MALSVMNNIAALFATRQLSISNAKLNSSLEKLSSGYRINHAADDAAGLAISERLRAQISGIGQAKKNVMDGVSMVQTAEGALDEFGSILQRMRVLAVQAANGTLTTSDRQLISAEVSQLMSELDRMSSSVTFNGVNLLGGTASSSAAGSVILQVGGSDGQIIVMSIGTFSTTAVGINNILASYTLSTAAAGSAVSLLDNAINKVNSQRSQLGAIQNRLLNTYNFLGIQEENLTASESRIRDVDFATEMIEFTKNQILVQAGSAMLAQANLMPQAVLQLFR
ncbi:MAG TPA: flagellin [bacterium]|nr:flagellin [bacterium]HOL48745.1 flagellin [bacterium]